VQSSGRKISKNRTLNFDRQRISDPAGAVRTRLEIGQIQGVWIPMDSGAHSFVPIRAHSCVEISIFARSGGEQRAPEIFSWSRMNSKNSREYFSRGARNPHQ